MPAASNLTKPITPSLHRTQMALFGLQPPINEGPTEPPSSHATNPPKPPRGRSAVFTESNIDSPAESRPSAQEERDRVHHSPLNTLIPNRGEKQPRTALSNITRRRPTSTAEDHTESLAYSTYHSSFFCLVSFICQFQKMGHVNGKAWNGKWHVKEFLCSLYFIYRSLLYIWYLQIVMDAYNGYKSRVIIGLALITPGGG